MKTSILHNCIEQFKNTFNQELVQKLAKQTKFIQRPYAGKLDPFIFLLVMTVELTSSGACALQSIVEKCTKYGGDLITAQALSKRLNNTQTLLFFKAMYSEVLKKHLSTSSGKVLASGFLEPFKNVYIEDSTSCTLNEKNAGTFPGSGGSGSLAGYKLHTIIEGVSNRIVDIKTTPSAVNDQSEVDHVLPFLKKGDLVLRDLGYFSIPSFKRIKEKGAYFISRFKGGVYVYDDKGRRIKDLGEYVDKKMRNTGIDHFHIRIGAKEKFLVRLVAGRVPQHVYDQRIRERRRQAIKSGRTLSESVRRLQKFTFLVTNISEEFLEAEAFYTVYKLRWQVELLFKAFKRGFFIDLIRSKSPIRVECFIIAKLIAILVTHRFFVCVNLFMELRHRREVSFTKFVRWFIEHNFLLLLFDPWKVNLNIFMRKSRCLLLCKQKRSRKTTKELIEQKVTYGTFYPLSHLEVGI